MILSATALVLALSAQVPQSSFTGKLGTPYLIGTVGRVAGESKVIELGNSRIITLKSFRTALSFGMKKETIVASEGKMLLIFEATIKNPENRTVEVSDSACFGMRVYNAKFPKGAARYRGSSTASREILYLKLKSKESVDVWSVYEFPQNLSELKIALTFHTYVPKQDPRFDLTSLVEKPTSIFAESALSYANTATAALNQKFDFDEVQAKVLGIKPTTDGGYAVRVEFTNPMVLPAKWGWQYAKTTVEDSQGKSTNFYPDFYIDPEHQNWGMSIAPGRAITGEYRFYPPAGSSPTKFTITRNSTNRTVTIPLGS